MTTHASPTNATCSPPQRWEQMCTRFEELIEKWLAQTTVPQPQTDDRPLDTIKMQKEWGQQLASVSMAARRVLCLRTLLCDLPDLTEKEDDDNAEATDTPERRHWRALQTETNPDSDEE